MQVEFLAQYGPLRISREILSQEYTLSTPSLGPETKWNFTHMKCYQYIYLQIIVAYLFIFGGER